MSQNRYVTGTANPEVISNTVVGRGSSNETTANAVKQKSEHHLRTPPQHLAPHGKGKGKEDKPVGSKEKEAKRYQHVFSPSGRMSKTAQHKYNSMSHRAIRKKQDHNPKHVSFTPRAKSNMGVLVHASGGHPILKKKPWKPMLIPEDHQSRF